MLIGGRNDLGRTGKGAKRPDKPYCLEADLLFQHCSSYKKNVGGTSFDPSQTALLDDGFKGFHVRLMSRHSL